MRIFWALLACLAAAAIAGIAAGGGCSGQVVGPAGGTGTDSSATGTDSEHGCGDGVCTDSTGTYCCPGDTGTGSSTGTVSCLTCACNTVIGAGGCEEVCNGSSDGGLTPSFCADAGASASCSMCIASLCGVSDPASCN